MLTQCPNCQTIFRVTSEILRVAEGQVRCGRCQRQFDALERLIDETDDLEASGPHSGLRASTSAQDIEVEEPATHEEITMEGRHIEISGTYRVPDRFGNATDLKQETTEEWVEIEDEDLEPVSLPSTNSADSDDEETASDTAQDEPSLAADAVDREPDVDEDFGQIQATPIRTTDSPRFAYDRTHAAGVESSADLDLFAPRPQPQPIIWKLLAAPLALLLILQWAHNYRATLARHPTIGPPVLEVYRSLGIPLTPNWDLHAYQIRQWGVISDPATPGTLRVRASITNLADFAQPYPLLKLMLEDRWGEQVRAREFEPSEYLDPTIAPNRLLSPGQQANATIAIMDPGPDAEGFRFDVCLRGSGGTVCAQEVRRR